MSKRNKLGNSIPLRRFKFIFPCYYSHYLVLWRRRVERIIKVLGA